MNIKTLKWSSTIPKCSINQAVMWKSNEYWSIPSESNGGIYCQNEIEYNEWMSQSKLCVSQTVIAASCSITNGAQSTYRWWAGPWKILILMNLDILYRFCDNTHTLSPNHHKYFKSQAKMYIYQKIPFSKVLESIYPSLWNITLIEWAKVKMPFVGKINFN